MVLILSLLCSRILNDSPFKKCQLLGLIFKAHCNVAPVYSSSFIFCHVLPLSLYCGNIGLCAMLGIPFVYLSFVHIQNLLSTYCILSNLCLVNDHLMLFATSMYIKANTFYMAWVKYQISKMSLQLQMRQHFFF